MVKKAGKGRIAVFVLLAVGLAAILVAIIAAPKVQACACEQLNQLTQPEQLEQEKQIASIAKKSAEVERCSCLVYERNCIIALKANFESKSKYDEFCQRLEKEIKASYQIDNVFICGNPKIMCMIDTIAKASEQRREEIIEKLLGEIGQR